MKNLLIICVVILSGCDMSLTEYEAHVKYCKDRGYDTQATEGWSRGTVHSVKCVKDGRIFDSELRMDNMK